MKDNEILLKAIEFAKKNGFVLDNHKHFCEIGKDDLTGVVVSLGAYESILFDPAFCKAFFVDEFACDVQLEESDDEGNGVVYVSTVIPYWKAMMMQMAMSEDRIKFLQDFI